MTVALPHLIFLTVLLAAAWIVWITDRNWPWHDTATAVPAAVVAGLATGYILSAWMA